MALRTTKAWALPMGVAGALSVLAGCGGGGLKPEALGAGEAIGEAFKCTPAKLKGDLTPFTVDWNDGERTALESAMRKGVAVVAMTCEGPKVLRACQVAGDYRYNGVSKKTKLVQMKDLLTVAANFGGVLSTAAFRGEMSRGRSLNLAYVLVGNQATSVNDVQPVQLAGRCEGATHFVFEAQLGAFVLETAEAGKAEASVDSLFGNAHAKDESSKSTRTTDGDPKNCDIASRKDAEPVDGCSALMRVELMAIRGAPDGGVKVTGAAAMASSGEALLAQGGTTRTALGCPAGLAYVDGVCETPKPSAPALCSYDQPEACLKACEAGSVESCDRWGFAQLQTWDALRRTWYVFDESASDSMEKLDKYQRKDEWRPQFVAWADGVLQHEDRLQAACDQDFKAACGALGVSIYTRAWSPQASDADFNRWKDAALKGCGLGDVFSCVAVHHAGMTITREDRMAPNISNQEKWETYQRSCSNGNGAACALAVSFEMWQLFSSKPTVTRYTKESISKLDLAQEFVGTLDRACVGGYGDGCVLAAGLRLGDKAQCQAMIEGASDNPRMFQYQAYGPPEQQPAGGCEAFATSGVPADKAGALASLKNGCTAGHALSCQKLDTFFAGNR